MSKTKRKNFNVILQGDQRYRLTPAQVFRLWKCAVKDDDSLADAAIEKLYEEMIAFNPARAESVIQLIIGRDDAAESIFRGLLRDMTIDRQHGRHVPWSAPASSSTTQHLEEIGSQDLIISETTRNKSNDSDVEA
jgi:hypothetical protein